MKKNIIGIREVILITLLTAVFLVLHIILSLPFMANNTLYFLFGKNLSLLLCAIIYILIVAKSPKTGTILLFFFLTGAYYSFSTALPVPVIVISVLGILAEAFLYYKNGYKNKVKLTAVYCVYGLVMLVTPVITLNMRKAQTIDTMLSRGLSMEEIQQMFSVFSTQNILIAFVIGIICALLGSMLGFKFLNKYFKTAGVVGDE